MKSIFLIAVILLTPLAAKLYSQTLSIYNNNTRFGIVNVISLNDKEIVTLKPKSVLIYKDLDTSTQKISIESIYIAKGKKYPFGKPIDNTYTFEKGKEYHITSKVNSMGAVEIKLANEKEIAKLKKAKYKETINK